MRTVVRQDMAAFLYRLAGSPDFDQAAAERANTLTDVKPGSGHYKEVLWLTSTGIAQGYPDHTFGGMRTVVRQDMAAFLHRYADNVAHAAKPAGTPKDFTDATPAPPTTTTSPWLSRTGITTGYGDGTFGGMRDVVRQDMAAFLHRTITNLKTPVDLNGLKAKTVVTASSSTYAIDQDGSLWAWGLNNFGQIGDGTTTNRLTPVKVPGLPKITTITTTGGYNSTAYATGEDGSLWAWGNNSSGQVGDGTGGPINIINNRTTPYKVPGLPKITTITTDGTVYATGEDGSLWTWGANDNGQVGDGTTTNRLTPYKVPGLPKITTITGSIAVYATDENGTIWAWGDR